MTKRFARILVVLALIHGVGGDPAHAAGPELLSYQGVLVQNNGVAVADGIYDLRFRLYSQQTAGTVLFEQTLSTQVTHGLYNVILSNNGGYDLSEIVSQNPQLFMEVTVEANLGLGVPSDITLLPRQQLASVPYALSAPSTATALVSAQTLSHTNPTNTQTTTTDWTPIASLSDLTLEVPSSDCVVEVQAHVVVGGEGGNTRVVGIRLDQSLNTAPYTAVRGPAIVTSDSATRPNSATVTYLLANSAPGSYAYRVSVRGDTAQEFILSPVVGPLASESTLTGKLWCP